jgi:hypothetical protein
LGLRTGSELDRAVQSVATENATGNIVHVRERLTGRRSETANHAPRRLLLADTQNGIAKFGSRETQMELGRGHR